MCIRDRKQGTEQEAAEEWSDMVWDSYEQQLYENGSQETVYFADLDKRETSVQKPLCLKSEEGGRKILLRDFPITFGKMQGRVTVVLEDRSVSRLHARIEAGEKGLYAVSYTHLKGTSELILALGHEAENAFEERKAAAKRKGEDCLLYTSSSRRYLRAWER